MLARYSSILEASNKTRHSIYIQVSNHDTPSPLTNLLIISRFKHALQKPIPPFKNLYHPPPAPSSISPSTFPKTHSRNPVTPILLQYFFQTPPELIVDILNLIILYPLLDILWHHPLGPSHAMLER